MLAGFDIGFSINFCEPEPNMQKIEVKRRPKITLKLLKVVLGRKNNHEFDSVRKNRRTYKFINRKLVFEFILKKFKKILLIPTREMILTTFHIMNSF